MMQVILAGLLIDGTGATVQRDRALYVEDGQIVGIEAAGDSAARATTAPSADGSTLRGIGAFLCRERCGRDWL